MIGAHILATASGSVFLNGDVGIIAAPQGAYALVIGGKNMLLQSGAVSVWAWTPSINCTSQTMQGFPAERGSNSSSRLEFKDDVQPAHGALATLLSLQGRTWRWSTLDLENLLPGRQAGPDRGRSGARVAVLD